MSKKIFISGSSSIRQLSPQQELLLDKIINDKNIILVGDCYGVDTLIQNYLYNKEYKNVYIYSTLKTPRNKINPEWKQIFVPTYNKYGRDFFTEKDIRMTNDCDYGLCIWDKKSQGTLANMYRLVRQNKICVLGYKDLSTIEIIQTLEDLEIFNTNSEK